MKQQKFNVKIEGITPYLMHRFAGMDDQKVSASKVRPGEPNWKAEGEKAIYRTEDGKIYVPSSQIHGCIINAGKQMKITGKGRNTYSKVFGAFLLIEPARMTIKPQKYEMDERPVVIQRARIIRYRPKWDKWELEFQIIAMTEEIPKAVLKEAIEYGGNYVGIGDFRPDKKGPFGRFICTEFKEIK